MILNLTKQTIVARRPFSASSFASRSRGMIFREFSDFDAMVFNRCNCIHTMLMRMNIDVIFVDSENRVCDLREKLVPWKPLVRCGLAWTVVELPEGAIQKSKTAVGDVLDLNAELASEIKEELGKRLIPTPETIMSPMEGTQKR